MPSLECSDGLNDLKSESPTKKVSFSSSLTMHYPKLPKTSLESIDVDDASLAQTPRSLANRLLSAFHSRQHGDSTDYFAILDIFASTKKSPDALSQEDCISWLSALSLVVSSLSQRNQHLVDEILFMPWITRDASFLESYQHFLEVLVSAHSVYVLSVCKMLIRHFRFGKDLLCSPF